jgi:hypothetical protein
MWRLGFSLGRIGIGSFGWRLGFSFWPYWIVCLALMITRIELFDDLDLEAASM